MFESVEEVWEEIVLKSATFDILFDVFTHTVYIFQS